MEKCPFSAVCELFILINFLISYHDFNRFSGTFVTNVLLTRLISSCFKKESLFPSSLDNIFSIFIAPLFILFPVFFIEYNFRIIELLIRYDFCSILIYCSYLIIPQITDSSDFVF